MARAIRMLLGNWLNCTATVRALAARRNGERLGECLMRIGRLTVEELYLALSLQRTSCLWGCRGMGPGSQPRTSCLQKWRGTGGSCRIIRRRDS